MNKSTLQCGDDRLGAIVDLKAHQDYADVALDGGLRDAKFGCNFLVAFAVNDEMQHSALARAEIGVRDARVEDAADRLGQKAAATIEAAQCADQCLVGHPLDDVAAGPGMQCPMNVFVALVGGEYNEFGIAMARP